MEPPIPAIDQPLAARLVAAQFPQWQHLPIAPVAVSGWDNRTFHLGEALAIRLPSAAIYAQQVAKEQHWLPWLGPQLPLSIPQPIAMGQPGFGYPWRWSVYRWLPGEALDQADSADHQLLAETLAGFLRALWKIDAAQGPRAGAHNFFRGGALSVYSAEVRTALGLIESQFDAKRIAQIWEAACETRWPRPAVWVHGDIASGNLLVNHGQLASVIDFGQLGVGDPACDTSIAWTFFTAEERARFRDALGLDSETWLRGAAWALWKALITLNGRVDTNPEKRHHSMRVVSEILSASL